ncbi:MAG: 6-bladed beta-propeller [Gemmatimonadota bacterium]|nr:6-bladed beta-propeller [Gemmatimonadota bacterium]MDE2986170.1 6-bladed beta-propeller [Gemmatimonadota bacterium]
MPTRPRSHRVPPLPLLLAATLSACAQGDPETGASDLTTTFDTAGGIIRVTNTGTAPEWRLAPVASIGPRSVTEEETPEEFGRVSSVTLGPEGTVFVADAANREIRVFGLDGTHLRTFGRQGEGPGEFQSIYSIAWVGDRLLTFDPPLGRIGEFSAEGEWLGQRRTTAGWTGSAALLRFYPVGPNEVFRYAIGPDLESLWVGHDSTGDTGDTLPRLPPRTEDLPGATPGITCEWEGGFGYYPHTVGAKLVRHPGSGGVMYSAWGYYYRVAVTTAGGDTLRVIERDLPAEPIPDEEWAAGSADFEDLRERRPEAQCDPRSYTRPERKPFIEEIFIAPDGKLWVDVIRAAGNRWEFFDPEGRLLGGVPAVPYKERTVPVFRGDYLVTIRQDDLDLDHVDVWRLERVGRQ